MTTCCCSLSQAAGLTFDEEGAALTYAIVFAYGSMDQASGEPILPTKPCRTRVGD